MKSMFKKNRSVRTDTDTYIVDGGLRKERDSV